MALTNLYLPEGRLLDTAENMTACSSKAELLRAMESRRVLEGTALCCTPEHDLTVALGPFTGLIPRAETALGIAEGNTRDIAILSRVGKPISFIVDSLEEADGQFRPLLSRKKAQQAALERLLAELVPGMVIPASVTHLEHFGAFVDIGCGVPSMIGIENISVSRIPHPDRHFTVGQEIFAAVLGVDQAMGRVLLTHKELLGTWAENAARFQPGMTVSGVIRGVKDYGAFVELTPNLSGLAELKGDLREGDRVSVYIKAISPDRMKIKLLVIDKLPAEPIPASLHYFVTGGRLTRWRYAPEDCAKAAGETVFT